MTQTPTPPAIQTLFDAVARRAAQSGAFGPVQHRDGLLACAAKASAEPAEYRLLVDSGRLWVALVTEHRWLSQSIEADLVHTGDKMEELLVEELIDQGWEPPPQLAVEHFRDEHKLYTFRSALPINLAAAASADSIDRAAKALLAYEAVFRVLGDMEAEKE